MSKKKNTTTGFEAPEQKEISRDRALKNAGPVSAVQRAVQVGMQQYRNTLRRLAK